MACNFSQFIDVMFIVVLIPRLQEAFLTETCVFKCSNASFVRAYKF